MPSGSEACYRVSLLVFSFLMMSSGGKMCPDTSELRPASSALTMARRPRQWRAFAWALVLAGAAGVLTVFLLMHRAEQARTRAEFERWAQIPASTLARDLNQHLDFLQSIAALFFSSREVDRQEFHRFTAAALKRLPGIQALLWAPRVPNEQRTSQEAAVHAEGWANYKILDLEGPPRLEVPPPLYCVPVLYVEPGGELASHLGLNLASHPVCAAAMKSALEQNVPVAVPLQAGGPVWAPEADWGIFQDAFLNGAPYETLPEREKNLAGYAVELIDLRRLVRTSLQSLPALVADRVAVRLVDPERQNALIYQSAGWSENSSQARQMESPFDLGAGGRRWQLFCQPTAVYLRRQQNRQSWFLLIVGLAMVGALGTTLHRAATRAERIERLVQQRTAEWEQSNQKLKAEIRERERTEEKLAQEQYLVRALMDNIPDMVYFKDLQSRFLRVNKALAARFKLSDPAEATGKTDFDFFTLEHAQPAFADEQEVIRTGQALVGREEKETWPDGPVTWVSTTKQCLRDQQGRIIGTFGISRDITAHKLAEQALAEKTEELLRSNRELEQFAYVASHDLQEPLRMIASYMQLLARRYRGKLDQDADEFISYAVDGAKRMQTLINDLLAYSRVSTHGKRFAATDCPQAVQHALANLQVAIQETGAVIHVGELPQVMADQMQLTQVFQNLIGNALKFRREQPPEIHLTAQPQPGPPGEWLFALRDNGIGIEPEHYERIFVIFQRLHNREQYPGTGIGLAVCKKVIERHGGRIWVESEPGRGSTFFFTLPQAGQREARD